MDEVDSAKARPRHNRRGLALPVRLVFLALAAACTLIPTNAPADEDNDELPAEVEKAFAEFSKKAADSRLDKVTAAVEERAAALADQLKLDAATKDKLAESYPKIVAATQSVWQERFQKTLRPSLARSADASETLSKWKPESMAGSTHYAWGRPDRTDAWREALDAVLTPAQLAEYATAQAAELQKWREELADYFLTCEEWAQSRIEPAMDAEIAQLKQFAELDEPRSDLLKAAAKSAVDETVKAWRQRWEDQLLEMDTEQREQRTRTQSYPQVDPAKDENPMAQQAWLDGIASVLTDAQRALVEKRRTAVRLLRSEALAMVLVDELNPFVGFTADQRTKLAKRFAEPLLGLPDRYFVANPTNNYYPIDPGQMFDKIADLAETEVLPLLDAGQARRWKSLSKESLALNRASSKGDLEDLAIPPPEELDAIGAQRLITAYIYLQAKQITQTYQLRMDAKIDSIAQLGPLAPEQAAVLRTAAKGAAQALASNDITNFENWARQNFQHVKPGDLPERLQRNSIPNFSNRASDDDPAIWTASIDRVLTDEQKTAVAAESDAAKQWRKDSQLAVMMTEVDKVLVLTPEKRSSLESILATVLDEYHEDLDNMFSFKWHIQGYYGMVPVALLSDEELAPALGADQILLVRARLPGHFDNLVENLQRNRKNREANNKATKKR